MRKLQILSRFAFLLCFSMMAYSASSQITYRSVEEDQKGFIYNRESTIDMAIMNNGFFVGWNKGKLMTYDKTSFFHISIGKLKHEKETRRSLSFLTPSSGQVSRSYIYGKQNSFYAIRSGFGRKKYYSEKAKRKGVAVGISYEAGPTLGIVKPYYLEVTPSDGTGGITTTSIRLTDANKELFTNPARISGASAWTRGLSEISAIPGVHGKFAIHLDWGAFDENVRSVEAGVLVDAFLKTPPIMVEFEESINRPIFLNFYLNFQLGRRY